MKILHLYYDIMNLYGEYGNIRGLTRMLEKSGIECEVDKRTLGEEIDFSFYDFVYMGAGTESNQKCVLADLKRYAKDITDYIEAGKVMLFTGNSFEILGKGILDAKGNQYKGLGIFDFKVKEQDKVRYGKDCVFEFDKLDKPLVGFINKCSAIMGIELPLFTVEMGLGNNKSENREGIHYKNFFGTHLTGPVLIKNPYFLEYIVSLLVGKDFKANMEAFQYEVAGYEVTVRELTKVKNEGK